MTVCETCSKHGKLIWEEEARPKPVSQKGKVQLTLRVPSKRPPRPPAETGLELVEGFDAKIRQAREKLGFSHEELGRKINEKVSLLRKIETGKMTPDIMLSTKLEHVLKIKLIVPASEEKIKAPSTTAAKTASSELTFGDLIQLPKRKKGKEGMAEREPS